MARRNTGFMRRVGDLSFAPRGRGTSPEEIEAARRHFYMYHSDPAYRERALQLRPLETASRPAPAVAEVRKEEPPAPVRRRRTPQIPIMTAEGVLRLAPLRRRKTALYVVTCKPTGRLYVGIARNPDARFRQHMRGTSGAVRIAAALTKFTPDDFAFEVLHTYANPREAGEAETALIAQLDLTGPNGMNTGRGGEGARRKKWIIEPVRDYEDHAQA